MKRCSCFIKQMFPALLFLGFTETHKPTSPQGPTFIDEQGCKLAVYQAVHCALALAYVQKTNECESTEGIPG